MDITRWCLMSALGVGLLGAGCTTTETSGQEDLGRGIVRGTLGAQLAHNARLPIPAHTVSFTGHVTAVEVRRTMPTNVFSIRGQVTAVEGGAYVLQESSGIEHRVAHDENTRIDRPAHIGDRIEVFLDDKGHAVIIRNIDQDERSQ